MAGRLGLCLLGQGIRFAQSRGAAFVLLSAAQHFATHAHLAGLARR